MRNQRWDINGGRRRNRLFGALPGALIGLLLALPAMAPAQQGQAQLVRLQAFMDQLISIEAAFTQTLVNPVDGETVRSRGSFQAVRPGFFRWDYTEPNQQLIVSDGEHIWYYEPDLMQATRAPAARLEGTPANFLISGGRVEETFTWEAVQDSQTHAPGIRLRPRNPTGANVMFSQLTVILTPQNDGVAVMEAVDNLGNRSRFQFFDMRVNQPVDLRVFQFTPPAGVDVIVE